MDIEEFPRYLEELEQARRAVPGVRILCGVEADYVEGAEEHMEKFLSSHPFDLVLMSVHFVRGWPGDAVGVRSPEGPAAAGEHLR